MAASESSAASVLPLRPDLEQYKKQARELLKSLQSGNTEPIERVRRAAPHVDPRTARLADAQLVIAREHGFASWPKFKLHVETANGDFAAKANAFVDAAIGNRLGVARQLLAESPGLERANIYTASAYGDVDAVRRLLDTNPALVVTAGGSRDRVPLLYACFSHFVRERETAILDTVRLLLDRGADPNSSYKENGWTSPALYGACGILGNPRLAAILIDAGANVDDNESLYHSVEHRDLACTRLLLERGARVDGTNALKHMLDHEDPTGLRLLLDHGADPNERNHNGENALHWAIYRHRSLPFVELLIDHGVDINAPRADGMTPYRMICQAGGGEVEDLLKRRGAQPILTPADELIAAAGRGDEGTIRKMTASYPDVIEAMTPSERSAIATFAGKGNTTAVALLLDAGLPIDARGDLNATPLHWAAWCGHPDTVQFLIDHGTPIEIEGADLGSTPLQWAIHASANNPNMTPERALAIVDALLDAGAIPRTLEMASDEVRAYIEERTRGM